MDASLRRFFMWSQEADAEQEVAVATPLCIELALVGCSMVTGRDFNMPWLTCMQYWIPYQYLHWSTQTVAVKCQLNSSSYIYPCIHHLLLLLLLHRPGSSLTLPSPVSYLHLVPVVHGSNVVPHVDCSLPVFCHEMDMQMKGRGGRGITLNHWHCLCVTTDDAHTHTHMHAHTHTHIIVITMSKSCDICTEIQTKPGRFGQVWSTVATPWSLPMAPAFSGFLVVSGREAVAHSYNMSLSETRAAWTPLIELRNPLLMLSEDQQFRDGQRPFSCCPQKVRHEQVVVGSFGRDVCSVIRKSDINKITDAGGQRCWTWVTLNSDECTCLFSVTAVCGFLLFVFVFPFCALCGWKDHTGYGLGTEDWCRPYTYPCRSSVVV